MSRPPKQPRREEQQQATQEAQRREGGQNEGGKLKRNWVVNDWWKAIRQILSITRHGHRHRHTTPLSLLLPLSLSSPAAAGGTAEGRQQLSSRSTTSFLELAARRGG
jgi:hypothetical protein